MIHRALMGSFERFIGILIEHYAGEFPLWLAPVQAVVLPIADRHLDYAGEVAASSRPPASGWRWTSAPSRSAEDPRRRAAQGPVHARGGRQGSRPDRAPVRGLGAVSRADRAGDTRGTHRGFDEFAILAE